MGSMQALVDSMIRSSFPELVDHDITVRWKKLGDAHAIVTPRRNKCWYLSFDKELKRSGIPQKALGGLVAHELCHILHDASLPDLLRVLEGFAYKSCRRYRQLVERNADLEVVLRGYGPHLLAFLLWEDGEEEPDDEGLRIRELRKITKL